MMGPSEHHRSSLGSTQAVHFGAFLKVLRHSYDIKQVQVLAVLPGWTQTSYSRLESDELAPAFDQLAALYAALRLAGVQFTPFDRHQFVTLARQRIEAKRSHQEHKSEQAWDELRLLLARGDHQEPSDHLPAQDHLLETRHLLGRGEWLQEVLGLLQGEVPKKLLILQGPIGSGKSSELHRLARSFLSTDPARPHLVLCELPAVERDLGAESALDIFLATVLAEVGTPGSAMPLASLATRVTFVLETLATTIRPTVLLLDNAEHLLDEHGQLAACWQQFLSQFLRHQHRACLVLATREWPGWFEGERLFVAEMLLPPLSEEMGAVLLQQLGLTAVATEHLRKVSAAVGGIPLCLEWVASLVQEPLLFDTWDDVDTLNEDEHSELAASHHGSVLTQRLLALLEDPSLFGGPIASKLTPLLQRILDHRLSPEAGQVLNRLAISNIPLGKSALQVLCPRPSLLKELRSTSLLAATAQRVQIVPMVAAQLRARLSPQQQHALEEELISALTRWLDEGKMSTSEAGGVVAELAALYLKLHRLLEAAELLIRYGWLSFNQGYGPRLARLAQNRMQEFDWHRTEDNECGGLLLYYFLSTYLNETTDAKDRFADYHCLYATALAGRITLHPVTEGHIVNDLMQYNMNELRFEEAQAILESSCDRLELFQANDLELQMSLLEKRAWLFGRWSEYLQEQGGIQRAETLREQAIILYKQCCALLSTDRNGLSPLAGSLLKRRLARALSNLSYHLNRIGQFEEALQTVEHAIVLREQGYVEVGLLAASYGEKSQILVELGRFQEALFFDEKAVVEIQRWANAGHALSLEERWVYYVNRGRLYLRLGKINEAEQLLREALPLVRLRRRTYRMFAEEALGEIEQWRRTANSSHHQLDWRWVERFRELDAFDTYWWWAHAGPFTREEEQQWQRLCTQNTDEVAKEQLGALLSQSRERELMIAISEQREPHLHYPTIDIEEVRRRITALLQLDAEVGQDEPNPLVRRLYQEKIEEEVCFLRMIEATYEGNTERFWECSQCVYPKPTPEEMEYVLSRVKLLLLQGLHSPETADISQQLLQFWHERLHLPFDPSTEVSPMQPVQEKNSLPSAQPQRMVTAQTAKRFFETVLRESGFEGWQVVVDKASTTRVEAGLRRIILADGPLPIERVRYYLIHELGSHVARSIAGEHSPLGLLGIGTKNYSLTEEGLALYNEHQVATQYGQTFSDWGTWLGTLSTGLASGVVTPPQTFLSLFTFLELLFLLRRLRQQQDNDEKIAQEKARKTALANCLRTYRGVPNLEKEGVCLTKDVVYLRGLQMIEQAVTNDKTVLDRLAVGKVALEYLPDLQELGIVSPPQSLMRLALAPDLDSYIISFEQSDEQSEVMGKKHP
jgi:tetratricopeptide (TPR) repeat protein